MCFDKAVYISEKKTKIVLALRNPKDVCVSFYHHHKGMRFYNYDGEFNDYVPTFLAGECKYCPASQE